MNGAYYNENNRDAAAWLRELIRAGHVAFGDVDERSIEDVGPADLRGYTQCHFFAGIGVWSHALRRAGWPDDRPVWTGSCPCQPFSAAGKGDGFADERHLWPAWFQLIAQLRPAVVFGEQVASNDGLRWLDLVHADLEAADYSFGAVDYCAAGAGAPHIRQRLWFVADAERRPSERHRLEVAGAARDAEDEVRERERVRLDAGHGGVAGVLAHSSSTRLPTREREVVPGAIGDDQGRTTEQRGGALVEWLPCRDGKWRPTQPGLFPLAHGPAARVVRLRGYGNAIHAGAASTFIRSFIDLTT